MAHASLRDIASRAGVSFQTAGKVLNGRGSVSPETRRRILKAAEELSYVPNALARSLKTQTTRTIGIVASDLSDYVLAQFVIGAEREARRRRQGVLVTNVDRAGSDVRHCLRILRERRVDGILMAAPQAERSPEVGEMLRDLKAPAVSIHHIVGGGVLLVGSDHRKTGLLATRHLLELGHQKVATVTGSERRNVTLSRSGGYEQALKEFGVTYDPALVVAGDWEAEGGYRATQRLLDQEPKITAIFAQSDTMAIGVLSALHDRGLSVPEDCAVVGCDDIPLAAYTIPPLSTVHVPFYETGETAMRLLVAAIAGRAEKTQRVLLPVHLVRRASCGSDARGPTAP